MTLGAMASNLKIRSNVYPMPADLSVCHLSEVSEAHKRFIREIKDRATFVKLHSNLRKYGSTFQREGYDFGVCSCHPIKEVSFGPILKNNQIVYGCRCNIKDTCHNRRVEIKRASMRGKKMTCESCPRYED
jgi:hypothetical protein